MSFSNIYIAKKMPHHSKPTTSTHNLHVNIIILKKKELHTIESHQQAYSRETMNGDKTTKKKSCAHRQVRLRKVQSAMMAVN